MRGEERRQFKSTRRTPHTRNILPCSAAILLPTGRALALADLPMGLGFAGGGAFFADTEPAAAAKPAATRPVPAGRCRVDGVDFVSLGFVCGDPGVEWRGRGDESGAQV